jgi:tetratricopeptide (TPR) repeat protein
VRRYTESDLDDLSLVPKDAAEVVRNAETALRIADAEPGLRAEALLQAAGLLEHAGDEVRAEAALRRAVSEDRGDAESFVEPRATLGSFLLDRGRRDEARDLFEQARNAHPDEASVYEIAGEAWEAAGDLQEALRWFNLGYTRTEHLGHATFLRTGRWRIRQALEMPQDALDREDESERARLHGQLGRVLFNELLGDVHLVLFVPADDWDSWEASWPGGLQASHQEHLATLERRLVSLTEKGAVCVPLDRAGYEDFAAAGRLPTGEARTCVEYGQERAVQGHSRPWPPERNAPCWCQSGAKYKKCCQPRSR